jgi:hypothetical protein
LNQEAKRQALVDSLKHITPEMRKYLSNQKEWGKDELERPDFVWHILLQSFATWGTARGHEGLIENLDNYRRVTFEALSKLDAQERLRVLEDVFLAAMVRYGVMKAKLMARNYDLVAKMGGPEEATRQAFSQDGKEAKIAFMKRFYGIGPKYARNIWMDAYHPDFRDSIAVDLRIRKITKALGYSFKTYEEEERFYQDIAKEADLQAWEVDRLLYEYTDHFLSAISATEGERQNISGASTTDG